MIDGSFIYLDSIIPVIKPYQKGKVLWDILILLTIVMFFYLIPLQISFDFYYDEELLLIFNSMHLSAHISELLIIIPEMLLIIDTFLKFITGFYENGIVIIDKNKIMKHYLRKGFIFDILSYCPIIAQTFLKKSQVGGIMLKFVQLLMFCKIKRVKIIMSNFQEIMSLKGKHDYILNLINLAYKIVFFSHLLACIWHGITYYNDSNMTWLDSTGLRNKPWVSQYWATLYWSVSAMLTISNGDILPQNNLEYFVGIVIFLISALFFGYSINSMREIFDLMTKNQKSYK